MPYDNLTYPVPREHPFHPPRIFSELREVEPIAKAKLWNGQQVWLATRYEDARAVLTDHETFSQVPGPGYPTVSSSRGSTVHEEVSTFMRKDPPEHTAKRRMVTADFTMKRANALRPRMTEIIDAVIDKMIEKGAPIDLHANFALPLPTTIITEYLGLPIEDHEFIQEMSSKKLSMATDGALARKCQLELQAYLDGQLRTKALVAGAEDISAKLMNTYVRTGELTQEEAVGVLELLLTAGHETTANMLSLGTLLLLQHPDQLELLRNDRSLMSSAVNEMLRYLTINQNVCGRVCIKDTVLGGKAIRAGEGVFAVLPSANRDEVVYPDPDKFDIKRNPFNQLAFGFGAHQCLGLTLAKVEMDVAFNRLLDRMPSLKLAVPFENLDFKNDAIVFGVRALPVAW